MTGSWDPTWEQVHRGREWGVNPLPDFWSFVMRHCRTIEQARATHVLDMGCGGGASVLFLAQHGFQVHAVDASPSAVALTRRRLDASGLTAELLVLDADRLEDAFAPESMDWAVDVACVQCNQAEGRRAIVGQMRRVLRPRGLVYSRMTAAGSWGEGTGIKLEEGTYTDIQEGPAQGVGAQHFATRQEVLELYDWLDMDGHVVLDNRTDPFRRHWWLEWVVEGRKRG